MEYRILERREERYEVDLRTEETGPVLQEQFIVFTLVEYIIEGQTITVEIPHFMPPSEEYIILGIENRGVTERLKMETA
jgi:hypothetical protein